MNLKEAFRYQSFLDDMLNEAKSNLTFSGNATSVKERHLRHAANAEATDIEEEVVTDGDHFDSEDLIRFMGRLIEEREKLGKAVTAAKADAELDIDAAIEANQFRRTFASALRSMLRYNESVRKEQGTGYRFNAEGNQMPYKYDIEVVTSLTFDKAKVKKTMLGALKKADEVSHAIDAIKVNTLVEYEEPFDVNGTFADTMETFLSLS